MSEEYATTRQDFLTATASYLGLPLDSVSNDSELKTDDAGMMVAVLHVWLKPSDIIGIGKRMQEIAKEQGDIVEVHADPESDGFMPNNCELRREYSALSQAEKGKHGSFGKYVTWRMMNDKPVPEVTPAMKYILQRATDRAEAIRQMDAVGGRQVTHVDAPEEPEPTNMDAVWVHDDLTTKAQRQFPVDTRQTIDGYEYLIQWSMLTDEQKQKAQEAKP